MTRIHFHVTIFNSFDKPFHAKGLPTRGTSTIQLYLLYNYTTLYTINPLNSTSDWSVTSLGKIHTLSSQQGLRILKLIR